MIRRASRIAGRRAWILAVGWLVACGAGPTAPPDAVPGEPRRIVVLAPAAAEIVDALGLADRVVGIGEYGPWPATIVGRPVVGGYDRPNVETLLELKCDLVLTAASEAGQAAHRTLERVGIAVEALDTGTEDGVFDAIERLGRLFSREAQARQLAGAMRDELQAIEREARHAPPRRVLFVVGHDPLYVAGPGSHIDEMIRRVGGVNVAADALAPYQQLSIEAILERGPEVVIDTSDNRATGPFGRVAGAWQRWEFLPAVRDDRVYRVAPGRLVIPGLRLPAMTRRMGRMIQPELFGEPTPEDLGPADRLGGAPGA